MGNRQGRMSSIEPLSLATINERVVHAQYAVRGEIVIRAQEIEQELAQHIGNHPFDKIIYCNIGNPQQLGQPPLSFVRQVLAICDCPQLLEVEQVVNAWAPDVVARAKEYLENIPGGTGAYSSSQGALICRQHVAEGIQARDGYACNTDDLFLTDGASAGVHMMMNILVRDANDAILVPIPQYPLYSACLTLYGGTLVPYYLDESREWGLEIAHLESQIEAARHSGKRVRAITVINPGNPTGACLDDANMRGIVELCRKYSLVLLADEVYQDNVYAADKQFCSFKKLLCDMNDRSVVLASFHSTSKGFYGECGRRGGYMEVMNMPEDVKGQLVKLASINLCSNLSGQICTALMMKPPQKGDASYEAYVSEQESVLSSLKRRAMMLHATLNGLEGVSCNAPDGALYLFPRIVLPKKAEAAAAEIGRAADWLYCLQLLEHTGIVAVPGSGFKQRDGTYHFRLTFLPPENDMEVVAQSIADFHRTFMDRFRDDAPRDGDAAAANQRSQRRTSKPHASSSSSRRHHASAGATDADEAVDRKSIDTVVHAAAAYDVPSPAVVVTDVASVAPATTAMSDVTTTGTVPLSAAATPATAVVTTAAAVEQPVVSSVVSVDETAIATAHNVNDGAVVGNQAGDGVDSQPDVPETTPGSTGAALTS